MNTIIKDINIIVMISETNDYINNIAFNIPNFADKMMEKFKFNSNNYALRTKNIVPQTTVIPTNITNDSISSSDKLLNSNIAFTKLNDVISNKISDYNQSITPDMVLQAASIEQSIDVLHNTNMNQTVAPISNIKPQQISNIPHETHPTYQNNDQFINSIDQQKFRYINVNEFINDIKRMCDKKTIIYFSILLIIIFSTIGYEYYTRIISINSSNSLHIVKSKKSKKSKKNSKN